MCFSRVLLGCRFTHRCRRTHVKNSFDLRALAFPRVVTAIRRHQPATVSFPLFLLFSRGIGAEFAKLPCLTLCAKSSGIGFSSGTAVSNAWSLCILADRPLSISRWSVPRGTRGKAGAKMSSDHDIVQHFFTCQVIPRHLGDGIQSRALVHPTSLTWVHCCSLFKGPDHFSNRFVTAISWLPGLCAVDIFAA